MKKERIKEEFRAKESAVTTCKPSLRRGFTLIELLIVVLIIGILVAVAVPQYKMAVAKSRSAQLLVRMDALDKAVRLYKLANGRWPTDVRVLDLGIEEGGSRFAKTSISNYGHTGVIYQDDSQCEVSYPNHEEIACRNKDFTLVSVSHQLKWCAALSSEGEKICKSLSPLKRTDWRYSNGFHRWLL